MRKWAFSPEEIIIVNKRGALHTADRLISETLALLNLACRRIDEAIIYLNRIEPLEDVLIKQPGMIDPDVAGEEWNERQKLGMVLSQTRKRLLTLREAKLEAVERLEAEIKKLAASAAKKANPLKSPKTVKKAAIVVSGVMPPVTVKVEMPEGAAPPLIIDPKLLERMRQELADRAKTVDE